MFKKILIGLVAFMVLLLAAAFMLPSKIDVSKSINVRASGNYVYEEISELRNWSAWSYWQAQDTTMQVTYGAITNGANASYTWVGSEGPGSLNFTENVSNKSIKFDLRFMEDGDAAKGWFAFEPKGDDTKLTCGFVFEHGLNPISRWFGFLLIEPEMKKAFEFELEKIKQLAEAKYKLRANISEEVLSSIFYVGLSSKISSKDQVAINAQMDKDFTELQNALKRANVTSSAHPFCYFPVYSEEYIEMICALQVPSEVKLPSKYKVLPTEGGRVVKAIHLGDYTKLEETHKQVMEYIDYHKLEIRGVPWESYVTNPFVVTDTAKWITEVYYPVKK